MSTIVVFGLSGSGLPCVWPYFSWFSLGCIESSFVNCTHVCILGQCNQCYQIKSLHYIISHAWYFEHKQTNNARPKIKVHTNLCEANIYPIQMGLPEKIEAFKKYASKKNRSKCYASRQAICPLIKFCELHELDFAVNCTTHSLV